MIKEKLLRIRVQGRGQCQGNEMTVYMSGLVIHLHLSVHSRSKLEPDSPLKWPCTDPYFIPVASRAIKVLLDQITARQDCYRTVQSFKSVLKSIYCHFHNSSTTSDDN